MPKFSPVEIIPVEIVPWQTPPPPPYTPFFLPSCVCVWHSPVHVKVQCAGFHVSQHPGQVSQDRATGLVFGT